MKFIEKHIKLITVMLSIVTVIFIFSCLKPTFWVKANYNEQELIKNENIFTKSENVIGQELTQNLTFINISERNQYIAIGNTSAKTVPNIVIKDDVLVCSGTCGCILFENNHWITVLNENKIVYICKMNKSSLPQPDTEEPMVDESSSIPEKESNVMPPAQTKSEEVEPEVTIPEEDVPKVETPPKETEPTTPPDEEKTPPKETTPKEPEFTVKDADKTQYVTASSLNVRKGPGTNYDKIGSLGLNDKVHVIGTVDNGWVKIEYKDKTAFVSAKYLSDKKVEEKPSSSGNNIANYPNAYGVLKISSIGVDVVLYDKQIYESSQSIVDKKNSAAYLYATEYYGMDLIADHKHQGFSAIANAKPNSTKAKIITHNGTKTYICTDKFKGTNTGSDLVDKNGVSIEGRNNGGICMYTCYPSHPDIIITFWQPC